MIFLATPRYQVKKGKPPVELIDALFKPLCIRVQCVPAVLLAISGFTLLPDGKPAGPCGEGSRLQAPPTTC